MTNINSLKQKIELLRKKMYQMYENNPNDPQILFISQSLDKLLNDLEQSSSCANKEEK